MADKNDKDKTKTSIERFQLSYQKSKQGLHKLELELNRKKIIVVSDHGRKISRPYRWDH